MVVRRFFLHAVYLTLCLLKILGCVDVNVTPNKRKMFIENEKLLFALVKVIFYDLRTTY